MKFKTKLLAAVLAAGSAGAVLAQDIKVGVTLSATGPAASLGIPERNTFPLMPQTIGGRKIQYIVLDDASGRKTMRVATQSIYRGIQESIRRLSRELKKMEDKVTSGKNFTRPSDNPVAVVNSLGLRSKLAQIGQYQKNMDTGQAWLDMNETVRNQVSNLAARAQEIALQLCSGNQTAEVRTAAVSEIDHLLNEAIGLETPS